MTHQLDLFDAFPTVLSDNSQDDRLVTAGFDGEHASAVAKDFRLAGLSLLGRGTPLVESAKSYIMRLSQEHCYHVNDMVKLIGSRSVLSHRCPKDWLGRFHDTAFADAGVAEDWLPVIAARNGVSHLEEGLVASWGSLLGKNRGSGIWTTRWCAHCLQQFHREGRAYLPLAWSVGLVTACGIHGTVLETACHHCGAGQTPTGKSTRRFAMHAPGVCGTCGEWLGACDPRNPDQAPRSTAVACNQDVVTANQIGSLLERPMATNESFGVHRVLMEVCEQHFAGSITRLAEWIGLNKSTVHGWLSGSVIPEVGRLVTLASQLQITLRDLVVGRTDALQHSPSHSKIALAPRDRSAPRADEKRRSLREMLASERDLPVREAARRLGMNHRDVYYHVSNDATAHSQDRRRVQAEARQDRNSRAQRAVFAKIAEVHHDLGLSSIRALRASAAAACPTLSYAQQQTTVHEVLAVVAT